MTMWLVADKRDTFVHLFDELVPMQRCPLTVECNKKLREFIAESAYCLTDVITTTHVVESDQVTANVEHNRPSAAQTKMPANKKLSPHGQFKCNNTTDVFYNM